MDFFGKALYQYWKGNKSSKLYFIQNNQEKFEIDLERYFREFNKLSALEKEAIKLAYGDILDVGCATGYYIPALKKRGNVDAIDISEYAIRIAEESGIENSHIANIFKYKPKKKFNTIILLENNIGLAGTLSKTKKMLKILAGLLKRNGQILCIIAKCKTVDSWGVLFTPLWNGKKGKSFKWLHFSIKFLSKICAKFNLNLEILGEDDNPEENWCLIKISHI